MGPEDIPDVGRFAIVGDPQGAVIALFKTTSTPWGEPAPTAPGRTSWAELYTTDWPKALDFYTAMFGWKKGQAMEMPDGMGTYQMFDRGEEMIGGMMNKPPSVPHAVWLYYVNVEDIDAAAGRVRSNGGKIVLEPMEVPGGMWVLQAVDPQGVQFALIGPKKS
jgi:predicted enzyme related to lactoylglutathione lyase